MLVSVPSQPCSLSFLHPPGLGVGSVAVGGSSPGGIPRMAQKPLLAWNRFLFAKLLTGSFHLHSKCQEKECVSHPPHTNSSYRFSLQIKAREFFCCCFLLTIPDWKPAVPTLLSGWVPALQKLIFTKVQLKTLETLGRSWSSLWVLILVRFIDVFLSK